MMEIIERIFFMWLIYILIVFHEHICISGEQYNHELALNRVKNAGNIIVIDQWRCS